MIFKRKTMLYAVSVLLILVLSGLGITVFWIYSMGYGRTLIEIDIVQNTDLIRNTVIGEPPQFAVWLEHPETGEVKTLFVTYRSGTGDWVGKGQCREALPRWYEIYEKEFNTTSLPTPYDAVPLAVTGATPKTDHFRIHAEVEPGSEWRVWVEVNLAGDFNKSYVYYDYKKGKMDDHYIGQPSLVYKAALKAKIGNEVQPELFAQSSLGVGGVTVLEPVSDSVTTAREIFQSIKIRVIRSMSENSRMHGSDPNLIQRVEFDEYKDS